METNDVKIMSLRRDGECGCGVLVPRGTQAGWHRSRRVVICASCLKADLPEVVDVGTPGGSLDREHGRRTALREQRIRVKHPHIGGLLLKLSGPVRTTEAFAIGAQGEREVADRLQREVGDSVLFLFNRRVSSVRASGDIDIIAVAPTGVWVIDPKKYAGKKIRANRSRDTFIIDGRKRPKLAESMRRQIESVTAGVGAGPIAAAPVSAAYCFLGADLPWHRLVVGGVPAFGIRGLVKALQQPGPLDEGQRHVLHVDLARLFPPA